MLDAEIAGAVDDGFGAVADAFKANFTQANEVGAAFAAYQGRRKLVDVWGGSPIRPRARGGSGILLQLVFSGTKTLTTGVVLVLVDQQRLHIDRPVAEYWCEFEANGKAAITVGEILSYRAGLAGMANDLTPSDVLDGPRMAGLLADQAPYWPTRTRGSLITR